jgi:hypothetical protein
MADSSMEVVENELPSVSVRIPQPAALGLQWSRAFAPAAMGGSIASALTLLPLGAFVGMVVGGVIAVVLYRRREPGANLSAWMGARLGAMSGAFGFAIFIVFAAVTATFFDGGPKLQQALQQSMDLAAKRSSDPVAAQQMLQIFRTPEGLAALMLIGLVLTLIGFVILAGLGGAIGAAWIRRRQSH